jgi:uncharacterized protein (DUF2267 family)
MDHARFIERVRAHLGPTDAGDLDEAVEATMAALGELVGHTHRAELAAALPEKLSRPFRDAHYDATRGREALVARVADSEHVPEGLALEHATAVLSALAEGLDEDVRRVLERELPEDVRPWVRPKEEHPPPPGVHGHPAPHPPHHVSEARPGSEHPISEAEPRRAQRGSVAASADPHEDVKFSTAHGLTQEREHETLAEGEPGPDRPLSEGGD